MPVSPNDEAEEGLSQSGGTGGGELQDKAKMDEEVESDRAGVMDGTVGGDQ